MNMTHRGGRPRVRPPFRFLGTLPNGLVQGAGYFSVQSGMGVAMIDGRLYRLRIQANDAEYEEVSLGFINSPILPQVWMQQTVETMVIQDYQSDPILYDGSTATRSNPRRGGVPRGKSMAYINGRLWVAVNDNTLQAGDIRTEDARSELQFTETTYLTGGGRLTFPFRINGLAPMPTSGKGVQDAALLVGGDSAVKGVQADIVSRDIWGTVPSFVFDILDDTGFAGQASIVRVNQDVFWRDPDGGFRSIRTSQADEQTPGNVPVSREVSRLTDYDWTGHLWACPAVTFGNRVFVGCSPYRNSANGISWRSLAVMDFAPISTMQNKGSPIWEGEWSGLPVTHAFAGRINGVKRAFVVCHDEGGGNSLFEIMPDNAGAVGDVVANCEAPGETVSVPITSYIEFRRVDFGEDGIRKRLSRLDVFPAEIDGQVSVRAQWRADNAQRWQDWDSWTVCAKTSDPEVPGETVHVWKNLRPQQRPRVKSFTIPTRIDAVTKFAAHIGFDFQIRLIVTGRCTIDRAILWAVPIDEPEHAQRDLISAECEADDV